MPDQMSFIARHAGGFFIYGLSVLDAYKIARVKWETWRYAQSRSQEQPVTAAPGDGA